MTVITVGEMTLAWATDDRSARSIVIAIQPRMNTSSRYAATRVPTPTTTSPSATSSTRAGAGRAGVHSTGAAPTPALTIGPDGVVAGSSRAPLVRSSSMPAIVAGQGPEDE